MVWLISKWILILNFIHITASQTSSELLTQVSSDYVTWKLSAFPETATGLGIHDHDTNLTQYTTSAFLSNKEECEGLLVELNKADREQLTGEDKNSYDILKTELEQYIEGYNWLEYGNLNPVNFLEGVQRTPSWIKQMQFQNKQDFDNYNTRIALYPTQIDQIIDLMRTAIEVNRTNHMVSMNRVPGQIEGDMKTGNQSGFYWPYMEKIQDSTVTESERENLQNIAMNVIDNEINPALQRLKDFILNEYNNYTRSGYGVSSWTNGLEYYKACLKFHISYDVTPEFINATGYAEFNRIKANMEKIMNDNGFNGTLADYFVHLRENERDKYYDHDEDWLINQYKHIVYDVIDPKILDLFHRVAPFPLKVEPQPYDGAPASYSLSLHTFFVNTRGAENVSSFDMAAIAAHEANPGHHYQLTTASQLPLPDFRKKRFSSGMYSTPFGFPRYTSYTEGWGLYAEYLGEEMNIYNQTALEMFGRYSTEIFRACRLIVDSGIHAFGMSRQDAIDLMVANTAFSYSQIETEIDRYITWPGQACAYKIGELAIRGWRTNATHRLGDKFDVRDFHNAVIGTGSAPLHVVERAVNEYVSDKLSSPTSPASFGVKPSSSVHLIMIFIVIQSFRELNKLFIG